MLNETGKRTIQEAAGTKFTEAALMEKFKKKLEESFGNQKNPISNPKNKIFGN